MVVSYVYDFGMVFMLLKILYKGDVLSEIEFNLMWLYVYKSV